MKSYKYLLLIILISISLTVFSQNKYTIDNGALVLPKPILFEKSTDKIKTESKETLDFIKAYLNDKSYVTLIRIEGNSFLETGNDANQLLSEKRAMAVAKYLVDNGIDCKRIIAVGFGKDKPYSNVNSENDRILIKNAMLNGKAIGGMPVDGGGKVAGDCCK